MNGPALMYPTPKNRVTSGYRFTEFGSSQDRVWEGHDLDSILYSVLMEILPLGDGMRRIGAMRDALDEALRRRGREALGLPVVAPSADTPVTRAREKLQEAVSLANGYQYGGCAGDMFSELVPLVRAALEALEYA